MHSLTFAINLGGSKQWALRLDAADHHPPSVDTNEKQKRESEKMQANIFAH